MKGKLLVVGFGPGSKEDMSFKAYEAMKHADIITGFTTYINLVKPLFPDKQFKHTPMTGEIDRCRMAIEDAKSGLNVAIISSGDSGIYGMAGLVYQLVDEMNADIDVEVIPGITAGSSAAAILGAPLIHDTAFISLSDRLTDLDLIYKRIRLCAEADMNIVIYNPKSKGRPDYLENVKIILLGIKKKTTPVGVVRNIGRDGCESWISTLDDFDCNKVDMFCTVIVGNSQTYISHGKIITPRGYEKKM